MEYNICKYFLHHSIFMSSKCFYLLLKLQALSNVSSYSNGFVQNALETLLRTDVGAAAQCVIWYLIMQDLYIYDVSYCCYKKHPEITPINLDVSRDFCIAFHFQRAASAYYINLIARVRNFLETPKALYEVCRIMCKIRVSRCYYPMGVRVPGERYSVI